MRWSLRIAQGRKEREIDPAAAALRACMAEAEGDPKVSAVARARLAEMQGFVEKLNRWYDQMLGVPPAKIMALISMGTKVVNFLGFGRGRKAREKPAILFGVISLNTEIGEGGENGAAAGEGSHSDPVPGARSRRGRRRDRRSALPRFGWRGGLGGAAGNDAGPLRQARRRLPHRSLCRRNRRMPDEPRGPASSPNSAG